MAVVLLPSFSLRLVVSLIVELELHLLNVNLLVVISMIRALLHGNGLSIPARDDATTGLLLVGLVRLIGFEHA